ncbi:MAG: type IV secretion system DNA-binding domain-containing protein [Pseudorhodoplanes sp.]|nr:type IV secretion system DNA-binding domain-containing protein [Pseudorhodoplanes sp.]
MSSSLPPYQPPSPYTPFLRRFTDERARDLSETIALYDEVRREFLNSPWSQDDIVERVANHIAECVGEVVELPNYRPLLEALDRCHHAVLKLESTIFTSPKIDWPVATLSLKEQVDLRRFLRSQQHFLHNSERIGDLLAGTVAGVFKGLIAELPPLPDGAASAFTVPLVSLLDEPGDIVDALIRAFCKPEHGDAGLFAALQEQFWRNICEVSGVLPDQELRKPLLPAGDSDLPPESMVRAYLAGTPFLDLFLTPVPFVIPLQSRFEHQWIVGGSGHGKTQLLQHLIVDDLQREDAPALIVIDSQGDMLRKIERLALFEDDDRLVIIDPEDDHPPALNMFDMSTGRLSGYSRLVREQIEAGIIELYNYVFGALAAELTAKQGTAFAFVARLMMSIPGATIHTLRELMEEDARSIHDSQFKDAVARLDPTARAFFENQFFNRNAFGQTKQQIARRLYGVLQVPAFDRMLSAKSSRLDMFAAMQDGKVVLVNTSKSLLKSEASALFGRFMIAQTLRAAYERVAVPEHERRPAFLIIDEASEYFDDSLETLLNQVRKFNLGVVFAHQYVDQLAPSLRASVAANTSIKMAGGVSDRDARALSADMRTTPDFLIGQRKDRNTPSRWTQFACYVRNATTQALSLEVPFGVLERAPKMSPMALAQVKALNRARYAALPDSAPATSPPAEPGAPRPAAAGPAQSPFAAPSSATPAAASQAEPAPAAEAETPVDDWRS